MTSMGLERLGPDQAKTQKRARMRSPAAKATRVHSRNWARFDVIGTNYIS